MSRCKHCGARALPLQTACDYCGMAYPKGESQGAERSVEKESPASTATEFERLLNHPDLERFIREGPSQPIPEERREGYSRFLMILVFVAIVAMGTGALRGARGLLRSPGIVVFVPLIFAVLRRKSRARSFPESPVESLPARLLEVTEPWGRAQDPRPRALIELVDGRRRFLRLRRDLIGHLKPRDMGVAFVKADVLVDFRRVPF